MDEIVKVYHQRNLLMGKIWWGMVSFWTVLYYSLDLPLYAYIDIVTNVILICLPLEWINRSKKFTLQAPYVLAVAMVLVIVITNLFFSYAGGEKLVNPYSMMMAFCYITIYPNYRPILLYGVLSLFFLHWCFAQEFGITRLLDEPNTVITYFMVGMTCFHGLAAHLSKKFYDDAQNKHEETLQVKAQVEAMLAQIRQWAEMLAAFRSGGRSQDVKQTMNIEAAFGHMEDLIKENERQFQLIQEKNKVLEQYTEQIERLTIQEERNRMARDLHDHLGHSFTAVMMGMESVKYLLDHDLDQARQKLDLVLEITRKGFAEVRTNIHQIASGEEEQTLAMQINDMTHEFAQQTNTVIDTCLIGEPYEVPCGVRIALVRCLQESLTNAVRHGQANVIDVTLEFAPHQIRLTVQDDGIGAEEPNAGFGLRSMRERIDLLQGTLDVTARRNRGFRITCVLPVKRTFEQKEIRLLLVDDQELIRESLHLLLDKEHDIEVIGIAENGQLAVNLCQEQEPNVILMDVNMPELNGVEATRRIKELRPDVRVIILTTFHELEYAVEAIKHGADGYLLKSIHPQKLIDSIRIVYSGGTLISQDVVKQLVENVQEVSTVQPEVAALQELSNNENDYGLTDRERVILTHLEQGLKYREIATELTFSENTIRNYISIIYSKLQVDNRTQAVKKAREERLIQ